MAFLAVGNGAAREFVYGPLTRSFMDARSVQQFSAFSAMFLFFGYAWWVQARLPLQGFRRALAVGGFWLVFTFVFECALGRLTGASWNDIFQNYNVLQGRLWPCVLLWVGLLPALTLRLGRAKRA